MEDYIYDGQPHALSHDWGYIIIKFDCFISESDLQGKALQLYRKYAEYLYDFDKEAVIDYLTRILKEEDASINSYDDFNLIYRPPIFSDVLAQSGTLAIKFRRLKEDTLGNK